MNKMTDKMLRRVALTSALLLGVNACLPADLYQDRFSRIKLGDSRAKVVQLMGEPNSSTATEIVVSVETLRWWALLHSRVYAVTFVAGHAFTTTVVNTDFPLN